MRASSRSVDKKSRKEFYSSEISKQWEKIIKKQEKSPFPIAKNFLLQTVSLADIIAKSNSNELEKLNKLLTEIADYITGKEKKLDETKLNIKNSNMAPACKEAFVFLLDAFHCATAADMKDNGRDNQSVNNVRDNLRALGDALHTRNPRKTDPKEETDEEEEEIEEQKKDEDTANKMDAIFYDAGVNVLREGLALSNGLMPNDGESNRQLDLMQESLKLAIEVVKKPTQENISALKQNVEKTALGAPSKFKRYLGALLILAGAAAMVLAPASLGVGLGLGALLVATGSIYSGRQKGLAKKLSKLAEEAEKELNSDRKKPSTS